MRATRYTPPIVLPRKQWTVLPLFLFTLCIDSFVQAQTPHRTPLTQSAGIPPTPPDLSDTVRGLLVAGLALSWLPASVGVDVAPETILTDPPRFLLWWEYQIPIPTARRFSLTAVFTNHRILLSAGMALGPQRGTDGSTALVSFLARAGYRWVWHPRGRFPGMLTGAGVGLESFPSWRPSLSGEIGLHAGPCCEDPLAFSLTLRTDVFFWRGTYLRQSLLLSFLFY